MEVAIFLQTALELENRSDIVAAELCVEWLLHGTNVKMAWWPDMSSLGPRTPMRTLLRSLCHEAEQETQEHCSGSASQPVRTPPTPPPPPSHAAILRPRRRQRSRSRSPRDNAGDVSPDDLVDILGPDLSQQLSLDSVSLVSEALSKDRFTTCHLLDRAVRKWHFGQMKSNGQVEAYLTSQIKTFLQFS